MKGFVYLLEIAIAAILITVVLSMFFAVRIKQNWERADLIAAGYNILNSIKYDNSYLIEILNENLTKIESLKARNINYGLKILGSSKSNIKVGCVSNKDYIEGLLTDTYVNGRWINFTVEDCIDISGGIPDYYDAFVFVNFSGYGTYKTEIDDYLNKGGVIMGINATFSNSNADFNNIFNLTSGTGSSSVINFTFYDPSKDEIAKYFLGIGMDAYSNWYIWEEQWSVTYGTNYVNITKSPIENRTFLYENSDFSLINPLDSKEYFFRVKKLWVNKIDFQILNKTFVFRDFSESSTPMRGNNIVGYSNYAAMTTNISAIWISDFPWSDEYRALVKAAIASKTNKWTAKEIYFTKERTTVSSFTPLCCDMPETAELQLTLWYEM